MTPIGKDITKRNKTACSLGELHAVCFFSSPRVCYVGTPFSTSVSNLNNTGQNVCICVNNFVSL